MKKIAIILLALVGVAFLTVGPASAIQYGFDNITNNNTGDAAIGEAQLFLDVTAEAGNQMKFLFSNIGPANSSITDVYFDDDATLLTFSGFQYSGNVLYTVGASPGNLPGGNDPSYNFSSNYDYDSDSPAQPKGVNPGETLGIVFNLNNATAQDVFTAIASGAFRVGIHVQGFRSGGSESFINDPGTPDGPAPTPEPGTIILLGFGLVGLAGLGRARMRK